MSAAFFHHDLAGIRQDAMSGLRELQQLSCQGLDALLVHVGSFQVRRSDGFKPISEKGQEVAILMQELADV